MMMKMMMMMMMMILNYNAVLRFLITNNIISDLHVFNFKTIIIIAEYLKKSTFKAIGHSTFIGICR